MIGILHCAENLIIEMIKKSEDITTFVFLVLISNAKCDTRLAAYVFVLAVG